MGATPSDESTPEDEGLTDDELAVSARGSNVGGYDEEEDAEDSTTSLSTMAKMSPGFDTAPPPGLTPAVRNIVAEDQPMPPAVDDKQIETVLTQFKWTLGGREVFVTGSFNKWQGKLAMNETDNGEFVLLLHIPPGIHHYKYIVDETWRLNPEAPTAEVNGIINNVVEVKRSFFEDAQQAFNDSDDDLEEKDADGRLLYYGQRAKVVEGKVPKLPPQLKYPLLDAPAPLPPAPKSSLATPDHVVLNHLYVYDADEDPERKDMLVTAITQRFKTKPSAVQMPMRSKFVTTVYYLAKPELPPD